MIKTLGGVVLVVVDVIAVKALILASHAVHHGNGVMEVGAAILVLNVAAWWVLLSGGSKPKSAPAQRRPGGYGGSPFGGSR